MDDWLAPLFVISCGCEPSGETEESVSPTSLCEICGEPVAEGFAVHDHCLRRELGL